MDDDNFWHVGRIAYWSLAAITAFAWYGFSHFSTETFDVVAPLMFTGIFLLVNAIMYRTEIRQAFRKTPAPTPEQAPSKAKKIPEPAETREAVMQLKLVKEALDNVVAEKHEIAQQDFMLGRAEKALRAAFDLDPSASFPGHVEDVPVTYDYDKLAGELLLYKAEIAYSRLDYQRKTYDDIIKFSSLSERQDHAHKVKKYTVEAYDNINRALKFAPHSPRHRMALAKIHIAVGKTAEARSLLQKMRVDYPDDLDTLRLLNTL